MKESAVPARSGCQPSAIAGKSKRSCFAVIAETTGRASASTLSKVMSQSSRAGRVCSSAATSASVSSIAASTNAKRNVTRRTWRRHIARGPLMSLRTVPVGRRHWRRYPIRRDRRVKIPYRAVLGHAGRHCRAATSASRSAIQAVVETAGKLSSSNADAVALRQTHSVIRARTKHLSACESVEPC